MRCSGCGYPRDETMAKKPDTDYRAEWLLCRACETSEAEQKVAQDNAKDAPMPSGMRMAVVPYRLNGEVHSG